MPTKQIKLVHFQITKNCNLRCSFCGQWGRKGFFADSVGDEMDYSNWEKVATELQKLNPKPKIMLWGGEPLCCPFFEKLVNMLRSKGFELGLITNGTMIDKYTEILQNQFKHIYISIDGTKEIHDSIRGKGIYQKVCDNVNLITKSQTKTSVMSVITTSLLSQLPYFVTEMENLNIDQLILQDMIAISKEEAYAYSMEMADAFGIKAKYIDSWITNTEVPKVANIPTSAKIKVEYLPHSTNEKCTSAYNHIHIAWNGDVMYCTDFYDFVAGNVKNESVIDIFNNQLSEKFRKEIYQGKCVTCKHCSWKSNKNYEL